MSVADSDLPPTAQSAASLRNSRKLFGSRQRSLNVFHKPVFRTSINRFFKHAELPSANGRRACISRTQKVIATSHSTECDHRTRAEPGTAVMLNCRYVGHGSPYFNAECRAPERIHVTAQSRWAGAAELQGCLAPRLHRRRTVPASDTVRRYRK